MAGHQELELRRHLYARHGVQAFLLEVANPRREAKPESPAYRENMVGETAGVGVVLVDDETAFVIEQPVEHMRRLVRARGVTSERMQILLNVGGLRCMNAQRLFLQLADETLGPQYVGSRTTTVSFLFEVIA